MADTPQHYELAGNSSIVTPTPLARWDGTQAQPGTLIFWKEFQINGAALLTTRGRILIRHAGQFVPPQYTIYANSRVLLTGPRETQAQLPPVSSVAPDINAVILVLDGENIESTVALYKHIKLQGQQFLSAGFYPAWWRVEVWGSSGSSAFPNNDGLGEIPPGNIAATTQLDIRIDPWPY